VQKYIKECRLQRREILKKLKEIDFFILKPGKIEIEL